MLCMLYMLCMLCMLGMLVTLCSCWAADASHMWPALPAPAHPPLLTRSRPLVPHLTSYTSLQLGAVEIALGDAVLLAGEDDEEAAPLALVQAMWQAADGAISLRSPRRRSSPARPPLWPPSSQRDRLSHVTFSQPPPPPPAGSKEVQVRLLARGEETVLGDAASDSEVFLTTGLETR